MCNALNQAKSLTCKAFDLFATFLPQALGEQKLLRIAGQKNAYSSTHFLMQEVVITQLVGTSDAAVSTHEQRT